MDHRTFNDVVEQQIALCEKVLGMKSTEYSTHDKLHNFKVAAALQLESPEEALGGMLAKHIVSIFDLIRKTAPDAPMDDLPSIAMWEEKITDGINYLLLLKALLIERSQNTVVVTISNTGG